MNICTGYNIYAHHPLDITLHLGNCLYSVQHLVVNKNEDAHERLLRRQNFEIGPMRYYGECYIHISNSKMDEIDSIICGKKTFDIYVREPYANHRPIMHIEKCVLAGQCKVKNNIVKVPFVAHRANINWMKSC